MIDRRSMSATLPPASRSRPLSIDDLILLNDELRGLILAGVPLDVGLSGFASRVQGRLRAFAERLAARVASGMPLEQAVEAEAGVLPDEYRLVMAVGLKTGRFDAALGSMARYAASVRALRSGLRRALIYPGIVCCLAFGLLVAVFAYVVPMLLHNIDSLELPHSRWYGWLERLHQSVKYWGIGIPAGLLALLVSIMAIRWIRRMLGGGTSTSQKLGLLRWVPGVGGALRAAHWARFAELLAVLVEAGVPYLEAARLSAGSVGDGRVLRAIEQLRGRMVLGQRRAEVLDQSCGLPPLLRWLMTWGEEESMLGPALREAAAQYRQRALMRAELVQRLVPLAVVVLVGGGLTAVYALTVFVPLTTMWGELAVNQ